MYRNRPNQSYSLINDIKDIELLCKAVLKDQELLTKKHQLIIKKIVKRVGNKPLRNDYGGPCSVIAYNVPKRKTHWKIFYKAYKNTTVNSTRFLSLHTYSENEKTYYIVLDSQSSDAVIIQLFSPHFVQRLMKRLNLTYRSDDVEIAQFLFDEEFKNLVEWDKSLNQTNYYQITKWGLSLGEYDQIQKVFYNKTFISKKELFEDQNQDLKLHFLKAIKDYDIIKYKSFIAHWSEYIDPVEMSSNEMLNVDFKQNEKPALDFLLKKITENWQK